MIAPFVILSTFLGCCSSVIFLELLINEDAGCGNLVTFSHFLFISLEGFIFTTKFGQKSPKVPIKEWLNLVIIYFIVNVMNNWTFSFNISMPLYMIFKSGSLVASLITEKIVLERKHSMSKHLSVFLITLGVCIYTFATSKSVEESSSGTVFEWSLGIILLSTSLILSARMGVYQEQIHGKFGRHPREALFYTHFLPLPGFLLIASNIKEHLTIALSSTPFHVNLLWTNLHIPCMVMYLIGSVVSQFVCASSVFWMTSEFSSLTVTLILTLRKFMSIVISILYFQNDFSSQHLLGAILVFIGTMLFSDSISRKFAFKSKSS